MRLAGWGLIASIVRRADVTLEVVDARNPMGTRSRRLERMVEVFGRELIVVINKADLVPLSVVSEWKRLFEDMGYKAVYVAAAGRKGIRVLKRAILGSVAAKPITVAVVGFPKVGKSSVINALKGKHSAPTSPVPGSPGYTRHVQLYKVDDDLYLLDTPGMIPVEGGGLEAVIRGKNPDELDDPVPVAAELLRTALRYNPRCVLEAYGIPGSDPYEILEKLALSRGWRYRSTGEPLIEEAARTVIRDYHKAKLRFYVPPEEFVARASKRVS